MVLQGLDQLHGLGSSGDHRRPSHLICRRPDHVMLGDGPWCRESTEPPCEANARFWKTKH